MSHQPSCECATGPCLCSTKGRNAICQNPRPGQWPHPGQPQTSAWSSPGSEAQKSFNRPPGFWDTHTWPRTQQPARGPPNPDAVTLLARQAVDLSRVGWTPGSQRPSVAAREPFTGPGGTGVGAAGAVAAAAPTPCAAGRRSSQAPRPGFSEAPWAAPSFPSSNACCMFPARCWGLVGSEVDRALPWELIAHGTSGCHVGQYHGAHRRATRALQLNDQRPRVGVSGRGHAGSGGKGGPCLTVLQDSAWEREQPCKAAARPLADDRGRGAFRGDFAEAWPWDQGLREGLGPGSGSCWGGTGLHQAAACAGDLAPGSSQRTRAVGWLVVFLWSSERGELGRRGGGRALGGPLCRPPQSSLKWSGGRKVLAQHPLAITVSEASRGLKADDPSFPRAIPSARTSPCPQSSLPGVACDPGRVPSLRGGALLLALV